MPLWSGAAFRSAFDMSWYCDSAPDNPIHAAYHDNEYGFPITDEAALFERLSLEIFQAGLSWFLVLKKRPAIVSAFDGFSVDVVARFGDSDVERLLSDKSIIRNRLKIVSIIENGKRLRAIRETHGDFAGWLAAHHPLSHSEWTKQFRNSFKFTGDEVVREFLLSIGYLPGAHREDCPAYARILRENPLWSQNRSSE